MSEVPLYQAGLQQRAAFRVFVRTGDRPRAGTDCEVRPGLQGYLAYKKPPPETRILKLETWNPKPGTPWHTSCEVDP